MKLTIDFELKTIEIEEPVNLKEATEKLQKLLGDDFGEYTISTKYNYAPVYPYPIIQPLPIQPLAPYYEDPYKPPYIVTCEAVDTGYGITIN